MLKPAVGAQERRRYDWNPLLHPQSVRQAAPRPVLRSSDEPSSEWIAFDIPTHSDEVTRLIDHGGPEPILIHVTKTGRLSMEMPANRVGERYPMQQAGHGLWVNRTQKQVPVIGHQAVGNQSRWMPFQALVQDFQKRLIVSGSAEEQLPADRSIDDMKNGGRLIGSKRSGHDWFAKALQRQCHSACGKQT